MKTTFIKIGSRLVPIPFWLWLAIIRIQKKYSEVKIWALRRLGIVYDFEGGRTQRAADLAVREPNSICRNCGMGVYCEECDNTPNR